MTVGKVTRRLAIALCSLSGVSDAANFDVSAAYSPTFTRASSIDLGSASYSRLLGFSLRLGYWSPVGIFEFESLSGVDTAPYLQDLSIMSLALRRYLFRQASFGPEEFWQQASLRLFEPYYGFGITRVDQLSVFLTLNETIGTTHLKAWGPHGFVGAEWDFLKFSSSGAPVAARVAGGGPRGGSGQAQAPNVPMTSSQFALFSEARFSLAIWPESVPAFVFYQGAVFAGFRARF
jgi:hypothetical protein